MQRYLLSPQQSVARPTGKSRRAGAVLFIAVLGVHVLGVAFFPILRRPLLQTPRDESSTSIAFLESIQPRQLPEVGKLHGPSPAKRKPTRAEVQSTVPPQTTQTDEPDNTTPIPVDWAKEAELAAAHRLAADAEADRRASALSPRRGRSLGVPDALAATPQFGWDHAHTHRVEPIPGGGLVVNLNDRCAIVIAFPFLLGGCKIGKIQSRGDLFSHMNDPPTLGDRGQ